MYLLLICLSLGVGFFELFIAVLIVRASRTRKQMLIGLFPVLLSLIGFVILPISINEVWANLYTVYLNGCVSDVFSGASQDSDKSFAVITTDSGEEYIIRLSDSSDFLKGQKITGSVVTGKTANGCIRMGDYNLRVVETIE